MWDEACLARACRTAGQGVRGKVVAKAAGGVARRIGPCQVRRSPRVERRGSARQARLPSFVVGDVHGHRDALARLLRDAGLIDGRERWTGADARLWLLGDLVDRGPDGLGSIELVMRLEQEGAGNVRCLLGNHDALILAVARYADDAIDATGLTFRLLWIVNGGSAVDLQRLEPRHLAWIEQLPAVARDGDWLLVHADTDAYLRLGSTPGAVNEAARAALAGGSPSELGQLLDVLFDRGAFADTARLDRVLTTLGGSRLVHGHTPIASIVNRDPGKITAPLVYARGRAVNVDHCLFAGGPGFVVELGEVAARADARRRRFSLRRRPSP